jgi:DNA-binding transcriptional LysR family regulator
VAVAEQGSFTVAATRLRISQPSLSQQVRALERDLGTGLLERTPRGTRLTAAGREFLPEARAMLTASQRGRLAVRQINALEGGELEIATVRSLAVGVLPAVIGEFRRRHPGVRIWLREFEHRDRMNEAVRAGLSDVAVGPRPGDWEGELRPLGWEEFVIVLPASDPLAADGGRVSLRQLADREWVLYEPGDGLNDVVMFSCAHAGFTPRPSLRTGQAEAAVRLAASGLGVALVPVNMVPDHLADTARRLREPIVRQLAAYARTQFSAAAAAFAEAAAVHSARRPPRAVVFP